MMTLSLLNMVSGVVGLHRTDLDIDGYFLAIHTPEACPTSSQRTGRIQEWLFILNKERPELLQQALSGLVAPLLAKIGVAPDDESLRATRKHLLEALFREGLDFYGDHVARIFHTEPPATPFIPLNEDGATRLNMRDALPPPGASVRSGILQMFVERTSAAIDALRELEARRGSLAAAEKAVAAVVCEQEMVTLQRRMRAALRHVQDGYDGGYFPFWDASVSEWKAQKFPIPEFEKCLLRNLENSKRSIERRAAELLTDSGDPSGAHPLRVSTSPRAHEQRPGASFPATVALFRILDIEELDGPTCSLSMTQLHCVVSETTKGRFPGVRILSAAGGAIVVFPDTTEMRAIDMICAAFARLTFEGIALRVGVAWGLVESIPDVDGSGNLIGRAINVAARHAFADNNKGMLIHESFTKQHADAIEKSHWLNLRSNPRIASIQGKRTEMFVAHMPPQTFEGLAETIVVSNASIQPELAVLVSYDLPKFSDGSHRLLLLRFSAVVDEVRRVVAGESDNYVFAPGGDGGIVALLGTKLVRALPLAEQLAQLLGASSSERSSDASIVSRIALHYGYVFMYTNGESRKRPTGPAVFDVDKLWSGANVGPSGVIMFSEALSDAISSHFPTVVVDEIIPPLKRPLGRELRRFVTRK